MSVDGDSKKANRLETVGNKETMNLHNILYQNVISSPYFKGLYERKTYHEVVDEIYNSVSSLEPFFKGTHASTAFCLLYKLWTLKLTVKQVNGLVTHTDSPHIRALGFLYLRYVCKPADLWEWFEPYLDDDEELQVEGGAKPRTMPMGRFLRELLTEHKWLGTILPRIPVPIARDLEKKLKDKPLLGAFGGYEPNDARVDRNGYSRDADEYDMRGGPQRGYGKDRGDRDPYDRHRGGRRTHEDEYDSHGKYGSRDRRSYNDRGQDYYRDHRERRDYRDIDYGDDRREPRRRSRSPRSDDRRDRGSGYRR
ncbi:PRP38 family-domain-containing protein [Gaertneriomyces semiglobifer]|nr:PRP38 family-domain-containing protein [Gaertneriomyces semiglobifer]